MQTSKIISVLAIALLAGCGKATSAYQEGHKSCSGRFPVDLDGDGRFGKHDAKLAAGQNWDAQMRDRKHRAAWVSGCADVIATNYASLRKLDPTLPPMKP
jgi:hypothetical protein